MTRGVTDCYWNLHLGFPSFWGFPGEVVDSGFSPGVENALCQLITSICIRICCEEEYHGGNGLPISASASQSTPVHPVLWWWWWWFHASRFRSCLLVLILILILVIIILGFAHDHARRD